MFTIEKNHWEKCPSLIYPLIQTHFSIDELHPKPTFKMISSDTVIVKVCICHLKFTLYGFCILCILFLHMQKFFAPVYQTHLT